MRGRPGGKIARLGRTGDVGIAGAVNGDGTALIKPAAAAEIGRVDDCRARAVQLGDEALVESRGVGPRFS